MKDYYYIPTSNLNLNNILSTESISPFSFYEKRGYGFKRFEKSISNSFNNSFLAFNSIPLTPIIRSEREEYPIYLGVPLGYLKEFKSHHIKGHVIYQIDSTIYLNWTECIFILDNEDRKKKLIASTGKSLEVKNSNFYLSNVRHLNELKVDVFEWDDSIIEEISDYKSINSERLLYDQRLNKLKGLVYGYACGLLRKQPNEFVEGKQYFQEFINSFSGLMNELSIYASGKKKIKSTKKLESQLNNLQDLRERIEILFTVKEQNEADNAILADFKIDEPTLKSLENFKYKNSRNSILTILRQFIKEKNKGLYTIDELLDMLIKQANSFIRYSSQWSYNKLAEDFNSIRELISSKISEYHETDIVTNRMDTVPFKLNTLYEVEALISDISVEENKYFNIVANELLSRLEMSSSDDIAQNRKDIVVGIAKRIKEIFNVEDSEELIYLRRLHKSLTTVGVGFKPNEIPNLSLQSIASFLSRYAELGKFQDFLEKNKVSNLSLAYAFWGASYGYANISKLFLSPLQSNVETLQVLVNYFRMLEGKSTIEKELKPVAQKKSFPERPRTIEWEIKKPTDSVHEPLSNEVSKPTFKSFIEKNKKLNKEEAWINEIDLCHKRIIERKVPEGPMFGKTYQVLEFTKLLSERAKHLKQFGKAKVVEATKVFEDFITKYE